MKKTSKTLQINDKTLTLETGVLAEQATSAVLGRLGDTMVLATVVMGHKDTTLDYFPLSVEYVERLYAGGRIKGSRWVKREGRPTDDAILTARLIDRSIRPLFPKALKKDVQIVITVLSVDGENDPDILAAVTTSAALAISKIPWNGPIGTTRVGVVESEGAQDFVVNPAPSAAEHLKLDMVVSSVENRTVMIEAEGKQASEAAAIEAIKRAKVWNGKLEEFINALVKEVGEKKIELAKDESLDTMKMLVEKSYKDDIYKIIEEGANKERFDELNEITEKIFALENANDSGIEKKKIAEAVDYIFKKTIRERILNEEKRPDGRSLTDVRPISAQVGMVPRVHGSGLFSRGQTQVLSVVTLGSSALEQLIESAEGEESKRYIHHYSFPPYSVGETGRMGTPNRREIGHGALAEKALRPVIPASSKFPYTIRIVSEVMSSNGSTSQGSVCGSTLALMDAGVPIEAPVAGIAIGLMTPVEDTYKGKYTLLTDIIGLEDFSGDMDFKVAGTKNGITAIQLDVKIPGLTDEMVDGTFERALTARLAILDTMVAAIPEARKEVSVYAPKIKLVKIPVEKIGDVIGSGGKTIRGIIAATGAEVNVEEDGTVTISAIDEEAVEKAAKWVDGLTRELEPGETFEGKVKRIVNFGAFVEVLPGKEGLVHVSEMSADYVSNPEDFVTLGQVVKVRVKKVDEMGRLDLSMLFGEDAEKKEREQAARPPREDRGGSRGGPRRDFGGRSGGGSRGGPRDNFPRRK